ncbi:MAG: ABC transporter substrate-binding protein [Chlorobi bacterium]|nr:ABC transporter substrate-binding protein [Chlorobiota bacterium]
MFFTACGGGGEEKPSLNYGGTFNVKISAPVEALDPNKINYTSDLFASLLVYEGLVRTGNDFDSIEPQLAEKWDKFNDGKKFIFHLRKNVKFHADPCFTKEYERNLSANDVLFTFERIADHNSPGINFSLFSDMIIGMRQFHEGETETIEGIKIIDSLTVEFNLSKPYVTFLKLLASPSAYILSETAVEYYGDEFGKHAIGTGPFKLSFWNPTEELFFIKNDDYWRRDKLGARLPFLDAVSFKILPTPDFRMTDFLKGECDFITLTRNDYQTAVKTVYSSKYRVQKTRRNFNVRFYGFSFDKNTRLAKDKNLRKAVAYSFDRKEIFNSPDFPFLPCQTLAPPPLLENEKVEWYSYDLTRGISIAEKINTGGEKYTIFSSVAAPSVKELEKGMKEIGLNVETAIHPKRYYREIIKSRPDIFRVSMRPSFPDPTEFYSLFYSKSGKFTNLFNYSNPDFDKAYELSLVEQDKSKRQKLFLRLEKILRDDVAALYISVEGEMYNFISSRVENFSVRNAYPDFSVIRLKK